MKHLLYTKKMKKGITLIELAMAVLILGLVAAGTTYGSKLIEESRITKMIVDLTELKGAYDVFTEKHSLPPGDLNVASTFWPNCAENNADCNGNGNGVVEHGISSQTDEVVAAMRHLNLE